MIQRCDTTSHKEDNYYLVTPSHLQLKTLLRARGNAIPRLSMGILEGNVIFFLSSSFFLLPSQLAFGNWLFFG